MAGQLERIQLSLPGCCGDCAHVSPNLTPEGMPDPGIVVAIPRGEALEWLHGTAVDPRGRRRSGWRSGRLDRTQIWGTRGGLHVLDKRLEYSMIQGKTPKESNC